MARESRIAPIIPHLTVNNGLAALDFYERAFGAKVVSKQTADEGKRLVHSVLALHGGYFFVYDEFPEWDGGATRAPQGVGCSTVAIHLHFSDREAADACYDRAVSAGAVPIISMGDKEWGERYGRLRDPFGHVWSFGAPAGNSGSPEA
jgi:PhnB protein